MLAGRLLGEGGHLSWGGGDGAEEKARTWRCAWAHLRTLCDLARQKSAYLSALPWGMEVPRHVERGLWARSSPVVRSQGAVIILGRLPGGGRGSVNKFAGGCTARRLENQAEHSIWKGVCGHVCMCAHGHGREEA